MTIKRESWLYLALFSKFCFHENPRESKRLCQDTYKISLTCWTIPRAITLEAMKIYAGLMVCECFHIHYLILISIIWKTCRANIITPIQQIKILHSEGVMFKVAQLINAWDEKETQSPDSWFGSFSAAPGCLLRSLWLQPISSQSASEDGYAALSTGHTRPKGRDHSHCEDHQLQGEHR